MDSIKILFVEDLFTDVEIAMREISKEKITFTHRVVETKDAFIKALMEFQPDLIVSDYSMPQFDGMSALNIVRSQSHDMPFIMLTGSMNEETAVACMKAGANDYVLKEKIRRLPFAVREVLQIHQTQKAKESALHDLRQSEKKYHLLVHRLNEGLIQVDNDDRVLFVNEKLCEMFGYKEEELIGRIGYEILISPEDHDVIKDKNVARKTTVHEKYEVRGRKKSGEQIWLRISGSAIRDDADNTVGSIGLMSDITEQKRIDQRLKAKVDELERFHRLTVGRELAMIELKKEVNELLLKLGQNEKYNIVGYPVDQKTI